jgi:hypothetical protein
MRHKIYVQPTIKLVNIRNAFPLLSLSNNFKAAERDRIEIYSDEGYNPTEALSRGGDIWEE